MNTKSDWQLVNERLMEEQRRTLGAPPTAAEMLAYTRGELPPEEEDRIRDFLVAYPELARAVVTRIPPEEAGDPSTSLGMSRGAAVVPFRRYLPTAIAAALALVFAGLYFQAESRARQTALQPFGAIEVHEVRPAGQRGGAGTVPLPATNAHHLLRLVTGDVMHYEQYRVEISQQGRAVWGETGVQRTDGNEFLILVPRSFLKPGEYDIVLYGIAGSAKQKIETYRVDVQ